MVRVTHLCFVDRCLSFCPFSFDHCVICSSSIYEFWLPLWYLQTLFIFSVFCFLMVPDQGYSINKYFLSNKLDIYVSIDLLKDSLIISTSTLFSQFLTHFSPICYFRATKQQNYITYDYNKILRICLCQIMLTQFRFVMTKRLNNWQITLDLLSFMAATSCNKGRSLSC